ncbi:MAG TPA: redoxin domain-containing protein [Syntrophales bacterium]|nr:redoxin domain-containing protein [Syntrophales bacterium]
MKKKTRNKGNLRKENRKKRDLRKNNTKTIVVVMAIIALVAGLSYFGWKFGWEKESSVPASTATPATAAVNPPDKNMTANAPRPSLYDLVNRQAPSFSLPDRHGNVYSSDTLLGKNVVLFFNEGLICYPACWNQIVSLSKDTRFKNADTVALSVVVDSKEAWQKAIDRMPALAEATVLFDQGATVSGEFGTLALPSSMHPGHLPGHTFVIIDKQGIVRYVFDDPSMGTRNDQLITEIARINS